MILGTGNNPINFIAVKDIVAALAEIMLNENFYNQVLPLGGPQNMSKNQVAELFGQALNIHPKVGHVPVAVLKVFSVLIQPLHPGIARIMKFSLATEHSDETMHIKNSIQQFGLEPTTMEDFIQTVIQKKPVKNA